MAENWWTVTHQNTWHRTKRVYNVNIPMPHINTQELAREWLLRELFEQGYKKLYFAGTCEINTGKHGDEIWRIEPCKQRKPREQVDERPKRHPADTLFVICFVIGTLLMWTFLLRRVILY